MPELDWLDRLHSEHPQSKIIAQWLLEVLEGRDLRTLTYRESEQAKILTNTLFDLIDSTSRAGGQTA